MNKKILIIFIVVVLVVAAGAYYLGIQKGMKKGAEAVEATYRELVEKAGTPVVNPMENLPTTNPFEGVNVNPFEEGYKNPFE